MYECTYCGFSTKLKTDYKRHLSTKKHISIVKNMEELSSPINDINENEPKRAKMSQSPKIDEPKRAKMSQNQVSQTKEVFACMYCKKIFKTKANLRRHELHRCKINKQNEKMLLLKLETEKDEKQRLYNQIEETYYPDSSQNTGGNNENTCSILENLGKRVKLEIFGTSKSFRDTATCKSMVMQYLCLFWGSDNRMYRNLCVWFEDVTNEDINLHVIAPRPPCRSFCVQVAEVCANDHHFLQLCYDIECPPEIDDCEPDPKVPNNGGLTPLDAGLGCNIPFAEDPYNSRNPATSLNHIGYKNLYYFTTLILGIIFSYLT